MSRNILFYRDLILKDNFETRIYLMFIHYSIILIALKHKKYKTDQENYNNLFFCIENDLRELGFGDISVNKKMKDLNKLFYDILFKLNIAKIGFKLNKKLIIKYFPILLNNNQKMKIYELYLDHFYKFCFEKSPESMIKEIRNFKF